MEDSVSIRCAWQTIRMYNIRVEINGVDAANN